VFRPIPPPPGRAVQVHPVKPTLKAPGTKRLKLKYNILLSSFAFNFNLRQYSRATARAALPSSSAPIDPR
jgi:hypothetical protein